MRRLLLMAVVLAAGCASEGPKETPRAPDPRRTALVELLERSLPGALDLTATVKNADGTAGGSVGSGVLLHPAGYILTNHHVAAGGGERRASLMGGETHPYRVLLLIPSPDLALVKIDAGRPLAALPFGRTHDVKVGEPVVVIGNPGGINHTATQGILSALHVGRGPFGSQAITSLQTDAAINGGNSGGPLINARGEVIGVVNAKRTDAENIGFAIPADVVREALAKAIRDEQRMGWRADFTVDPYGPARVDWVAESSALLVGDVIRRVGDVPVADVLHVFFALSECRPGALPIEVERDGVKMSVSSHLVEVPMAEPELVTDARPGLRCSLVRGDWTDLRDFDIAKALPGTHKSAARVTHAMYDGITESYGLRFIGWIRVPADGAWTLFTTSDDGSRVWIGDRLVVDNDGLHPPTEASGYVRLKAGFHSVEIDYFERGGGELLTFSWEGPGTPKQEVPAEALFSK